ncbi:MarC family protein [Polymorphobacter arshaanensis]|nr:MarC family protein [Polymorphobacter arshaanensis]
MLLAGAAGGDVAGSTMGAAATGIARVRAFPVMQVFTFLFLMLGPIKIIGPFASLTRTADPALTRRIAFRATLFASAALLLAAILGEHLLRNFGIPLPVLALSGGIILFLTAIVSVMQQFLPPATHDDSAAGPPPSLKVAMSPLAFPTIVTPYGIAALVVFLAVSPDLAGRLKVGAILLAIMGLNLLVMIAAKRILPLLSIVLPIIGAVLAVVQVALGLQIIQNSIKVIVAL